MYKKIKIENIFKSEIDEYLEFFNFKNVIAVNFFLDNRIKKIGISNENAEIIYNINDIQDLNDDFFYKIGSDYLIKEMPNLLEDDTLDNFIGKYINLTNGKTYCIVYGILDNSTKKINETIGAGKDISLFVEIEFSELDTFELQDINLQAEPIDECLTVKTTNFNLGVTS